ncbi:MAG: SDR family oxidoreductase [Chloroflexi bacterium]|nr:SDR family oxidoreductase [Chloroflexota bacterium]
MTRPIEQQVVVVTGASYGVGRAITREFANRGARVVLLGRSQEALAAAVKEAEATGTEALAVPTDVADAEAVERAAAAAEERFGRIDTWVNSAMVTVFSPVKEMTAAEYRRVTEVTYLGYVYGTLSALRRMLPRDEGTIIQIGSALVYRSIPLQSAYCGAKAAIRGFTDSLRCELIHDDSNVKLSMLQLPAVNTPQFDVSRSRMPRKAQPVPPIFTPELIARTTVWAAEHTPRELVIGGPALQAILGQKLIPGLLDRYLGRNGYESQLTPEPADRDRPDNLFTPVAGDPGAYGRFADQSSDYSVELWLRLHRGLLATAAVATAGLTAAALALAGRRTDQ